MMDIWTVTAALFGLAGVVISFLTLRRKTLAERRLEEMLKQRMELMNSIKHIGELRNDIAHSNRVMSLEQFVEVRERIRRIVQELERSEQKEILESLEQRSLKGQLDYLNKLLHASGSTETILVKKDSSGSNAS